MNPLPTVDSSPSSLGYLRVVAGDPFPEWLSRWRSLMALIESCSGQTRHHLAMESMPQRQHKGHFSYAR